MDVFSTVYGIISLTVAIITNIHDRTQILCSKNKLGILFCVSINNTMVVSYLTQAIAVILYIFKFILLVQSITDANLTAIACNIAILIEMKLYYVKNVLLALSMEILQHMILVEFCKWFIH